MTEMNRKTWTIVGLTMLAVWGVTELVARVTVSNARESIVALEDSLAAREARIAVLASDNAVRGVLLARKDSVIAADSAGWRLEREDLVRQSRVTNARANARAADLRVRLDSAEAVALDSVLADKDLAIAFQTERADNAEEALADVTDTYSGAQALLAGISSELALVRMDNTDLWAIIAEKDIVIDFYENPPLSKKLANAIPGGGLGVLVGFGAAFILTR